jgi:GNAT superfamily N-acetyltransferase
MVRPPLLLGTRSVTAHHDATQHVLADGARITIRSIRADDRAELQRAFGRLSAESRHRRFFGGPQTLSDERARYLTEVDGRNHVALVATMESHDLKEEIGLGVARFVRSPEQPEVAEAAITVADEAQNRGIGKRLLAELAAAAREQGIHTFRAEVLAENAPMRRILEQAGAAVAEDQPRGETVLLEVPLGPAPADEESASAHPLRRLLRAMAELVATVRARIDVSEGR